MLIGLILPSSIPYESVSLIQNELIEQYNGIWVITGVQNRWVLRKI